MTEEAKSTGDGQGGEDRSRDSDGRKSRRDKMGDGIKQGIGVLSDFRDALEETIQEARDRGDLSADRAKEIVKEALDKAQAAGEKARDRLDFATHSDMEAVRDAVAGLRDRVSRLEESVFGAAAADTAPDESVEGAGDEEA